MTSERHWGKEMTMLVNHRDGVSGEKTDRWRGKKMSKRTHTHTQKNRPFPPLYILIRGKLYPELPHIVRNFLSE